MRTWKAVRETSTDEPSSGIASAGAAAASDAIGSAAAIGATGMRAGAERLALITIRGAVMRTGIGWNAAATERSAQKTAATFMIE